LASILVSTQTLISYSKDGSTCWSRQLSLIMRAWVYSKIKSNEYEQQ